MEEPTKPAIVEDPVDIQLLKEIRDLLKENNIQVKMNKGETK